MLILALISAQKCPGIAQDCEIACVRLRDANRTYMPTPIFIFNYQQ